MDGGTDDLTDDAWQRVTADNSSLSTGVIRGDIASDPSGGLWIASRENQSLSGGLEYYSLSNGAIKKYSGSLSELDVNNSGQWIIASLLMCGSDMLIMVWE